MSDGAVIWLRRYGNPAGPRLVMSHGNGLAIEAYVLFWRQFLNSYDVVLFDMRNHGQNPLHEAAGHRWNRFVIDMEEILDAIDEQFGGKPVVGVFHSLSAVTAVKHADHYRGRWEGLILFDPPIYPRHGHPLQPVEDAHMHDMVRRASRRPSRYDNPALLAQQFKRRPEFQGWVPGAAEQLAEATLRRNTQTGSWELCCPREFEAYIYQTNNDLSVWTALCRPLKETPITIIGADPEMENQLPSASICRAVAEEACLPYCSIPRTTHFLQFEQPELCYKATIEALAEETRLRCG
jgi:pimeloyl-ACP methyl ester carboxylesterase